MSKTPNGTVIKSVDIAVPAHVAWAAISDVGQLHVRVAPGMIIDTQLQDDGAVRVVTFANKAVLTERIMSSDDATMRLAWTATGGPWTHHNASLTIVDKGNGCMASWTADVVPPEASAMISSFIEAGLAAFKTHMEGAHHG